MHGTPVPTSRFTREAPISQARDMPPLLLDPRKTLRVTDERGYPKNYDCNMDVNGREGDWINTRWRLKYENFTSSVDVGALQAPRRNVPELTLR